MSDRRWFIELDTTPSVTWTPDPDAPVTCVVSPEHVCEMCGEPVGEHQPALRGEDGLLELRLPASACSAYGMTSVGGIATFWMRKMI